MRILILAATLLLALPTLAADLTAERQSFDAQLKQFAKDKIVDHYKLQHLSNERIEVVLWYTPGTRYSSEEVGAYTDGVCFGMLKQAVQLGVRPFTGSMTISCQARQADSAAAGAPDRLLGQSNYDRQEDSFVYVPALSVPSSSLPAHR